MDYNIIGYVGRNENAGEIYATSDGVICLLHEAHAVIHLNLVNGVILHNTRLASNEIKCYRDYVIKNADADVEKNDNIPWLRFLSAR